MIETTIKFKKRKKKETEVQEEVKDSPKKKKNKEPKMVIDFEIKNIGHATEYVPSINYHICNCVGDFMQFLQIYVEHRDREADSTRLVVGSTYVKITGVEGNEEHLIYSVAEWFQSLEYTYPMAIKVKIINE